MYAWLVHPQDIVLWHHTKILKIKLLRETVTEFEV